MNRLPPPPPKRSHRQHSPRPRKSALERARELSRSQGPTFDPSQRGTWRGSSRDLVVNPPQLVSGYAYMCPTNLPGRATLRAPDDWKRSPDDDWDTVMISDSTLVRDRPQYLGRRRIDGVWCNVFRTQGRPEQWLAQTTVMSSNGSMNRNAGDEDVPAHLSPITFGSFSDPITENGERISYGSFNHPDRWNKRATEDQWYQVDYATGSDYSGGSVHESNYRVLKEELEREHPGDSQPVVWADAYGGHGTYGIVVVWSKLSEEIQEILSGLEDYPLISEDDHSQLEMEQQGDAWESWGRDDFLRHLVKCLNRDLHFDDDKEIEELELTDGEAYEIFNLAIQVANLNWEDQQGSGQYIDMEKAADAAADIITGSEKIPSWYDHVDKSAIEKIRNELGIRA